MKPTTAQIIESASTLLEPIVRHVRALPLDPDHPDLLTQRHLSALSMSIYVLLETALAGEELEDDG